MWINCTFAPSKRRGDFLASMIHLNATMAIIKNCSKKPVNEKKWPIRNVDITALFTHNMPLNPLS